MNFTINKNSLIIQDAWLAPFLNRKIKDEDSDLWRDDYWLDLYPEWSDTIIHFETEINEDGVIEGFECTKYRDLDYGSGRPQTDELKFNASDKSYFTKRLSEETVSRAEPLLDSLVIKAEETPLPGGWKITKTSKSNVIFSSGGGEITVSKKKLAYYIEIAHTYLEIIDVPEFWEANSKILNTEHKAPVMALLSLIDTDTFYNINKRKEEAKGRMIAATANDGYAALLKATEENDIEKIRELQHYAFFEQHVYSSSSLLANCIANNNDEGIGLMLKNNARTEGIKDKSGKSISILLLAMEKGDISLFEKVLQNSHNPWFDSSVFEKAAAIGRPEFIVSYIKNAKLNRPIILTDELLSFAPQILVNISGLSGIKWTDDALRMLYKEKEFKALKAALDSMRKSGAPELNPPGYSYGDYTRFTILYDAIDAGDFSQVEWVMDNLYSPYTFELLEAVRHRPGRQYKTFTEDEEKILEHIINNESISAEDIYNYGSINTFRDIFYYAGDETVNKFIMRYSDIFDREKYLFDLMSTAKERESSTVYSTLLKKKEKYLIDFAEKYEVSKDNNDKFFVALQSLDDIGKLSDRLLVSAMKKAEKLEYNWYIWFEYVPCLFSLIEKHSAGKEVMLEAEKLLNHAYHIWDNEMQGVDFAYEGPDISRYIEKLETICNKPLSGRK